MRFTTLFCFVLCYLAFKRGQSAITVDKVECGRRERLSSTGNLQHGSHPWHVGIFKIDTLLCGGTIIHSKFVVTGAQCMRSDDDVNKHDYGIVAGKINRLREELELGQQTVKVADIVVHEYYSGYATRYGADIALIKVQPPFSFNSVVSPVCFFRVNNQIQNNTPGTLVGWTEPWDSINYSEILQAVDGTIITGAKCLKTVLKEAVTLDKFCTINKSGDVTVISGGGVFYEDLGKTYLQGIISKNSQYQNISAHTSIPFHRDWIIQNMNKL